MLRMWLSKPVWMTRYWLSSWAITARLRWRDGVLEQMHRGSSGAERWEPVPTADETMPQDGGK